ncbi:hypothetical protein CEXT_51881 [Caerostris extrusa]|uniref:Uncharacterized protein n=1 Tax=Caerostris extrusa TaxID=172846 RepID=A0AAV4PT94_CAEEX|nr:hypothetical protein CEXT_51881 [Caerostris extrusa]
MTASASMIPEVSAEVASMALIMPDYGGQSRFTRQRFIMLVEKEVSLTNAVQHNNVKSENNTINSKNKTSFIGIIFQTVNVTSFSVNMMNLCRANVDFPLRSGIIRATEATSADASGIIDAEVVMAMNNKTEIMKKKKKAESCSSVTFSVK